MKYDLSILIPARNEQFISNTVEDILKNKRGKTEIIVGLDGEWADPPIKDHPDVRIVYVSESIGQRAMTNRLCRLSQSKYVAKADAHTAYDEGFDIKLLEAIAGHPDWTIVPVMKNLHAFDWKCPKCGSRWYQGPTPTECMQNIDKPGRGTTKNLGCDNTQGFYKKLVWQPREGGPSATSYRFDRTLHFQYFPEFKKRPEGKGDITPTMSLQGSFFMLTREKYWELDICDEKHGSWGQQGTEVACKTWLSGGEVMCVQTTWYAHMFRTQGGDFSFPYFISGRQTDHAREYSKEQFMMNGWDKTVRSLDWLIKRFNPPDWEISKGIIYYTDNRLPVKIAKAVQKQLKSIGLPITSTSLKPMDMGRNIVVEGERGYKTMFKQILTALESAREDIIFFCEHDVLYHPSHFDFIPPEKDKFYYNHNFWRVRSDGFAVHWDANQVSGLCCYREYAIAYYKKRLTELDDFNRSYEPGGRDRKLYSAWKSKDPNIDIRGDWNLTKSKWSPKDFRDKSTCVNWQETTTDKILGWDNLSSILNL